MNGVDLVPSDPSYDPANSIGKLKAEMVRVEKNWLELLPYNTAPYFQG